ncbi:3-oxo-5-alpha-steroid 4-dehydrogenase 2-like isoform X1 [Brienomyrus brachyistius]|uniref:3-oxo-5-alpha-steroid 4-dehydrogenase 2-like isoform X1 n=1 Tax=Brienomyrus brachyistius TaxID=42636 RepID=UPI0020B2D1C5|nr:3-oxo-5-alpha-steroid 4-dehydrogenase 2-like isoform X1 [Brienomyrus brachyistius]
MHCHGSLVTAYCCVLIAGGVGFSFRQARRQTPYGRYAALSASRRWVPAKPAWFFQELPSFLVPMLMCWGTGAKLRLGETLLLCLFCGHYFQRTFVYSLLTKGRPSPLRIVLSALIFCSVNGFVQSHYLLHCAAYGDAWLTDWRLLLGLIVFSIGMGINVHSDYILRNLRKPGELHYAIPKGGMFEYVSGANFLGEIIEWFGFAVAAWSVPALSFAVFTLCSIGPRAYHHHRFYLKFFSDYPQSRKAVIPFLF